MSITRSGTKFMPELITEAEFASAMENTTWLVSHGGVGSEELYRALDLSYPDLDIRGRPLRGVVSHLPRPYQKGPSKCIYLYGNPIEAIVSQLRRKHYDNPRKLYNDSLYPRTYDADDLLRIDNLDPFGLFGQFKAFCQDLADYPIMLLKNSTIQDHSQLVSHFAELCQPFEWQCRSRATTRSSIPLQLLTDLERLYGEADKIMRQMPDVVLRLPVWITGFRHSLAASDVTEYRPLLRARQFALGFAKGLFERTFRPELVRIKHVFEYEEFGKTLCVVNLRYDISPSEGGSIGYLLKINYDDGTISHISHADIILDGEFSGAEDPRYFQYQGQTCVIFNALCRDGNRRIFIYFDKFSECIKLIVPNFPLNPVEKNWAPFVVGERIHIIYSFNPMIVLRLDDDKTGYCSIIHPHAFLVSSMSAEPMYPFGGSSLSLWVWPLFVGLVHTKEYARRYDEGAQTPSSTAYLYRPAIVLFDAENMKVVGISKPFSVPEPAQAEKWRGKDVQYPYHLDITKGKCEIWIECQDRCPTKYIIDLNAFSEVVSTIAALQPFHLPSTQ